MPLSVDHIVRVEGGSSPGGDLAGIHTTGRQAPLHEGRTPGIAFAQSRTVEVHLDLRAVVMVRQLPYPELRLIGSGDAGRIRVDGLWRYYTNSATITTPSIKYKK